MGAMRDCPRKCINDGGWDYSDRDNPVRCDHGALQRAVSAAEERDRALAATEDANPQAFKAAVKIIHDAARHHPVLSSNLVRFEMDLAQIPGPVRGAAWRQACSDRVIRPAGTEPSTQPRTHAHAVRIYESLVFRPVLGCGEVAS